MKIKRKILLILMITLIAIATISFKSTVYGFEIYSDNVYQMIKTDPNGGTHFFPNEAEGGTLFCIQPGGELHVSGIMSRSDRNRYVGSSTDFNCTQCGPEVRKPWENGTHFYYSYSAGTVHKWYDNIDATYVLAEMEDRGQLESWESAYGIWNSSISTSQRIGDYEIIGESQAYTTFFNATHNGYTNDVFSSLISDNSSTIKEAVNQTDGTYKVGPFKIDYPDGYYNGANKFSWINSIEVVTDAGTLPVKKILSKSGEEINIADLGENGTKSLDNLEFYVVFASTSATQMSLKVEFGYLEHCEATMTEYNGVRINVNWYSATNGTHTHRGPDKPCSHYKGWYENGDPITEHSSDPTSTSYERKGYVCRESTGNASQVLMLAKDISKVRKTTTLYFTGAIPKVDSITSLTPSDKATPSNPNVINLTMNLAGTVFIDQDNGKVNSGDNKLGDGEGIGGIEVYLYQVGVDKPVTQTLTNSDGAYYFYNLNAQKQYYVEYVYNGMLYTNVERLDGNATNISKATETAQGRTTNREEFNSQFQNISSYPSNYYSYSRGGTNRVFYQDEIAEKFKDIANNYGSHENSDADVYAYDCRISAYTTEVYPLLKTFTLDNFTSYMAGEFYQAIYQEGGTYDQMHVNLGIKSRPTFDLALSKDVYNAVVEINGKTETYTYDARKDWTNSGFGFGVSEEDYLNTLRSKYMGENVGNLTKSKVYSDAEENSYTTEFRTEEIVNGNNINNAITDNKTYLFEKDENGEVKNYAWEDFDYELTGDDKLKIHVTYKIAVTNQSSVVGAVTEIVDYYDSNYEFETAYVGNENGERTGNVDYEPSNETGQWTTTTGTGYYKTIYLRPDQQNLGNGGTQYIYVTFGLIDPETTLTNAGLPSGKSLYTYNLAEINAYTTRLGIVDRDSIPGNFEPSTYEMGKTEFEDDTSKAPAYIYSHRTSRTLEGTVFEDINNGTATNDDYTVEVNKTRFGYGTIDVADKGIYGVKVELVEIKNGQLISRQTTYTNADGWYGFGAFVPGDYVIRFTYGSDDQTALTMYSQYKDDYITAYKSAYKTATGEEFEDKYGQAYDIVNKESYNGQDYQSTTTSFDKRTGTAQNGDNTTTVSYESSTYSNTTIYRYKKTENSVEVPYYWYNVPITVNGKEVNVSDATDDEDRRSQVIAYSNSEYGVGITNHKAEVFNSYIDQATLRANEAEYANTGDKTDFDPDVQAQPMNVDVDEREKNRALVNELERRTYMYAYTPEIPVEVEYTTQQISGTQASSNYTYKITGVDFGITERPRSQLTIDQDIDHIKVTATDGTTLLELQNNNNDKIELVGGTASYNWVLPGDINDYDKNELLNIILDDELLSGAKLEVTYAITVTNNSESDTGTTQAKTIINYVANNLNFDISDGDNALWEVVKNTDIQTDSNSTYINNDTDRNGDKLVDLSTQGTILKATDNNPLVQSLEPGESKTAKLTLKKTLSAESSSDDLSYSNLTEIVEIVNSVGRYDHGAIPGNQSLEEQPREHDTSGASRYDEVSVNKTTYPEDGKITVTPPTGSTPVYYVLGITATVILVAGIFIIKKFVIG